MKKVIRICSTFIQASCLGYICKQYLGSFVICTGTSMEPTIFENDILLIENRSVFNCDLKKGDIVIVQSPTNPKLLICKRITNISYDSDLKLNSKKIPKGHVWLEGDNKKHSFDSKQYGAVPYGLIKSKAFYKIWPFYDRGHIEVK